MWRRSAYGHCDGILLTWGTGCIADRTEHSSGPHGRFRACAFAGPRPGGASGRQQHRKAFNTGTGRGPRRATGADACATRGGNHRRTPTMLYRDRPRSPFRLLWPSPCLRVERPSCCQRRPRRPHGNAAPSIPLQLTRRNRPGLLNASLRDAGRSNAKWCTCLPVKYGAPQMRRSFPVGGRNVSSDTSRPCALIGFDSRTGTGCGRCVPGAYPGL